MSEQRIGTVAIVGAGAMGAMYAAHFAREGFETLLVARGSRAEFLRAERPIVNDEPLSAEVVDPHDPAVAGRTADLVLVAVKHHHLGAALEDVAPLVGARTTVLSVLNGLDSEQIVGERFTPEQVLPSIALAMDAQRDGSQVWFRSAGRLALGTIAATGSSPALGTAERLRSVQDALDRVGLAWSTPSDMRHELWWKFLVNTGGNQASAVTRATYRTLGQEGPAHSLMLALIDEVLQVARAEGVDLGDEDVARWQDVLADQNPDGLTSMTQDLLAGRRTEVDIFGGRVVELGRTHGIATPYNQTMVWLLA